MKFLSKAAAGVVAVVMVAGCGGNQGTPDGSSAAAGKGTQPAASERFAPNTGTRSLKVGQTREGPDITTTVQQVRVPYPPGRYRTPEKGNKFFGFKVRTCVRPGVKITAANRDEYRASSAGDFSFRDARGNDYGSGGNSWIDWPAPRYPEDRTMAAGECVMGWFAVEIPSKVTPTVLEFSPGEDHVADWRLEG